MVKNSLMITFNIFLLICCSILPATTVESKIDPFKASAQVAENWLQLVDQENYDQSWHTASPMLKTPIPLQTWINLTQNIRKPLGEVRSRKILEQKSVKDPANRPKGDYMALAYATSFSHKNEGHELVTLFQESDGQWQVLKYIVQ